MVSLTQWRWVWANSRRWWRTGKPDMLLSIWFQRVGYDWATEQLYLNWVFPGDLVVKLHLPMQEFQVWSLGQKDPLKKEMATHFSTIAWRIPWMKDPVWLQSMGSQRVGDYWSCIYSNLSGCPPPIYVSHYYLSALVCFFHNIFNFVIILLLFVC